MTKRVTKAYAVALPLLLVWLVCWIAFSWGAVQDDAFIHLRYADNLQLHHFITYDGVHANYGASSLLYVSALAMLRWLTASPDLPHATSSVMHLLLFLGLASLFARVALRSEIAGRAGLVLLLLICTPSAVRWLDDGMETVVVIGLVSLLAWLLHVEMYERQRSWPRCGLFLLLSFFAVLLRVELSLLCVLGFLILAAGQVENDRSLRNTKALTPQKIVGAFAWSSPLMVGGGLALLAIYSTMHVLLPDTALAKSHGVASWFNSVHDTVYTLGSAFSFGVGVAVFWLLTLFLILRAKGRLTATIALSNSLFPVLLAMAVARGQEIQGVRYFAWTFFFSIIWNILDLARQGFATVQEPALWPSSTVLLYGFLGAILLVLPVEGTVMCRVLMHRQATLRLFESQRLGVLQTRRGVASDIGFIGYFSKANLCDLAGLVNGRAAGKMNSQERMEACAATKPDFVFLNRSQLLSIAPAIDLSGWQICGAYDFTNVRQQDSHYLIVRSAIAVDVCRATGRSPESVAVLLPPGGVWVGALKGRKAETQ